MSFGPLTGRQITAALAEAMGHRGWSLRAFSGLREVFAKDSLVTPFYCGGDIRPMGDGCYGLGGSVGLVHRTFEESWRMRAQNGSELPLFSCVLLILNLRELANAAYVRADTLTQDMDVFTTLLDACLSDMPQSEQALFAAFETGVLCGKRIDAFSGYSQRPKFAEFRQFVLGSG